MAWGTYSGVANNLGLDLWGPKGMPAFNGGGKSSSRGDPTSESTSEQSSSSTTEQFLSPEKLQAFAALNDFLKNPLAGISSILQPLLAELIPSERMAREALNDEFRQAGASNSGAAAVQRRMLEGDILARRGQTAIKGGLAYLSPILQGYMGALNGIPALTKSTTTSSGSSSSKAYGNQPLQYQGRGGSSSVGNIGHSIFDPVSFNPGSGYGFGGPIMGGEGYSGPNPSAISPDISMIPGLMPEATGPLSQGESFLDNSGGGESDIFDFWS